MRRFLPLMSSDFSRLAGADEERTLARLRALRSDLIDPTVGVHNGRIVKRTGDGLIAEFRSVVDAVRCAIEIQNGMVERNAGLPPVRRIEFRMGVHLGDVVEESDGDLMGDGVNIASRLEGVADPGGICLSQLPNIAEGNGTAAEYHSFAMGVCTFLFYPGLICPVKEHEIHHGRKRIDIKYTNAAERGLRLIPLHPGQQNVVGAGSGL